MSTLQWMLEAVLNNQGSLSERLIAFSVLLCMLMMMIMVVAMFLKQFYRTLVQMVFWGLCLYGLFNVLQIPVVASFLTRNIDFLLTEYKRIQKEREVN